MRCAQTDPSASAHNSGMSSRLLNLMAAALLCLLALRPDGAVASAAAFVSYLMKTAGFSRAEFEFSDSHADYVQAAFAASNTEAAGRQATHAFRACDVATTHPRAGDLLCATRASTSARPASTRLQRRWPGAGRARASPCIATSSYAPMMAGTRSWRPLAETWSIP
ncbi:MAG: hypothetical protein JWP22_4420 [Ramlibacter sp.]|nr:hypothetical protein [Ramlibacter sp.]